MIPILVVVLFLFFLFCFERRRRNVAKKNCIYGELRHERVLLGSLDLVHDTLHLCTRFGDGGIKAMSRVISGDKQVIKFIYFFMFHLIWQLFQMFKF